MRRLLIAAAALACVAGVSRGAVIGSLSTAGSTPSGGHDFFGQTFTVPAGETGITSVTMVVRSGNAGATAGSVKLYSYDEGTQTFVGAPLFTQAVLVPVANEVLVSATPNLPVTAGETMALVMDWGTTGNTSGNVGTHYQTTNYYPGGHIIFTGANQLPFALPYDMAFQVEFGVIPEPALGIMGLGTLAVTLVRRRPRAN